MAIQHSQYNVDAPSSVITYLEARHGKESRTGERSDPTANVSVHVLADGYTALSVAAKVCADAGYEPLILSRSIRGEVRDAAKTHVAVAEEVCWTGNPVVPPAVVLSGGETTVTVSGDGTGGLNLEFALSAATELPLGVILGAVDTDGIDGATDAVGALVTSETVSGDIGAKAASTALDRNDVYPYLKDRDALLRSGITGTNVNDLRILVIPKTKI
ncbi:MOFRL family protein [Halorubrum laminariae]|uniref:MOFRL family protein n=1 Tax=Halorubrum laminariae TaxID=1433523 RepID=A0ABD6C229_9EURY|nr:MOFRL family protein [Halorubrum laminariae]